MLAAETDTQYYDVNLGIEEKRKLVKNALIWHMQSGTPSAVEELIVAVFGGGELQEWFEYGDDPFYFKIVTDMAMAENMTGQLVAMMDRVKNARSHLRVIEIKRRVDQNYYSGVAQHCVWKPSAIIDGYSTDSTANGETYPIVAGYSLNRPAAVQDGFEAKGEEIHATIYSNAGEAAIQKAEAIMEDMKMKNAVTQEIGIGISVGNNYKNTIKEQEE